MKHSESLATIGAALARAQSQVKVAVKGARNSHLNNNYADLGSIWDACREALTGNGLSVVQLPVADEPGYIALETIILHESGEYISQTARTPAKDAKGQETAQAVGSALTYLRRYALSAALGIVADEDDDGHAASAGPQRAQNGQGQGNRPSTPQRTAPGAQRASREDVDRSKDDVVIGQKGATRLDAELREMGVTGPIAYARKICNLPELEVLNDLTVKQARQLKHAAQGQQQKGQA